MTTTAMVLVVALSTVQSAPPAVQRAVDELRRCEDVDDPVCRGVPTRLANYGRVSVRPLMKAFEALPPAGRLLGVVALEQIEHKSSTNALIRLSSSGTYLVRTMALTALGKRSGRSVDKALVRAMRDRNPAIRAAAAEAIGKQEEARSRRIVFTPLMTAAKDTEVAVRMAAVESLGMLGEKKALDTVLDALSSNHKELRKSALFALRFLDDQRAVSDVIDDRVLVETAGKTLARLTGVDFGTDYELWKGWWAERDERATEPR